MFLVINYHESTAYNITGIVSSWNVVHRHGKIGNFSLMCCGGEKLDPKESCQLSSLQDHFRRLCGAIGFLCIDFFASAAVTTEAVPNGVTFHPNTGFEAVSKTIGEPSRLVSED